MPRSTWLLVSLLSASLLAGGWLAAQPAPKTKPKTEEVEAPIPKPKKILSDAEQPSSDPKTPVVVDGVIDLNDEAAYATQPKIKEFLKRFAMPHDLITLKNGELVRVSPLTRFTLAEPDKDIVLPYNGGDLKVYVVGKEGKLDADGRTLKGADIKFVGHYEHLILGECKELLAKNYDQLPKTSADYIERAKLLDLVARLRTLAARSLAASINAKHRVGDPWTQLQRRAQNEAVAARLEQLRVLAASNDAAAEELATRLNVDYQDNPTVAREVQLWQLTRWADRLGSASDAEYARIRTQLDALERLFPAGLDDKAVPKLRALRDKLQGRARQLFEMAQGLEAKDPKAKELLKAAAEIDPTLAGLQQARLKSESLYPVLVAAFDSLPMRMSPTMARTDADRAAVDLVFDSLIRPIASPTIGQDYRPGLAMLPRVVPMGREFEFSTEARWVDGEKGTVLGPARPSDVYQTLRALVKQPEHPEFLDAIDFDRVTVEATRLRVHFKRGVFEPLAGFDIKILPDSFLNKGNLDDKEFSEHPVGSGPFSFQNLNKQDGVATFVANPTYGARSATLDRPSIREVQMTTFAGDLKGRFTQGNLRLAVGLPTDQTVALLSAVPALKSVSVPHRRIHMLAVNHRHTDLKKSEVRRAVAHAIDRETLLTGVFRADQPKYHRALAGPFPPHVRWANDPNPHANPGSKADRMFNPDAAKGLLKAAGFTPEKPLRLKVRFSLNGPDSRDRAAVTALAKQVEEAKVGLELQPEGVDDVSSVLRTGDFELAYTPYDYANHLFSLSALLSSANAVQDRANFLKFEDQECDQLLAQIRDHRDFAVLQRQTQSLHKQFNQRWMPFVPLWQLDIHVVYRDDLQMVPEPERIDPLNVFRHADQWRIVKR